MLRRGKKKGRRQKARLLLPQTAGGGLKGGGRYAVGRNCWAKKGEKGKKGWAVFGKGKGGIVFRWLFRGGKA